MSEGMLGLLAVGCEQHRGIAMAAPASGPTVQPPPFVVVYAGDGFWVMDDQNAESGYGMLIIGAADGKLRLACEACGAHAIRPSSLLFWATRCQVCGEIAEIQAPRE